MHWGLAETRRTLWLTALFAVVFVAMFCLSFTTVSAQEPSIVQKHEQMLYPVVLIELQGPAGSGTVIFSAKRNDETHSYVLTNHHVIKSAIQIEKKWSPRKKKDVKRELRTPVIVKWFDYNALSREIGTHGKSADIVAYDDLLDLALLRIQDRESAILHVAKLLAENQPLYVFETTWAVGAGLGKPPFPTTGMISNLDQRINGNRYILSSSPIIFGNSGGALFHRRLDAEYEFIGVPARVSATGFATIVSHMAWVIPMETVRAFLRSACTGFILGDKKEQASCNKKEKEDGE